MKQNYLTKINQCVCYNTTLASQKYTKGTVPFVYFAISPHCHFATLRAWQMWEGWQRREGNIIRLIYNILYIILRHKCAYSADA